MNRPALDPALRELHRRAFLRGLGSLAAAGLLPAGCRGAAPGHAPPPGLALRSLSPRGYAVINAATSRFVGPAGREALHAGRVDPGARADALLARAPALAGALESALLVVEFGIYPLLGKLRPFSALDAPGRDAILAELAASRWALKRTLFKALKSVSMLAYYGSELHQPVSRHPGVAGATIEDAMTYPAAPPLP